MSKSRWLSKRLYRWTRQLHLYFGLFLCPFLILFAVSTIMLNHGVQPSPHLSTTTVPLAIPADVLAGVTDENALAAMDQQQKAQARQALVDHIVRELNLSGEIGGSGAVRNNQTAIGVSRPGMNTRVTVDVAAQQAEITVRRFGVLDTMRFLHLSPGPHSHPHWIASRAWGWVADTAVYAVIFLTLSGIYMWLVLRAERKAGLVFLGAGCVSFVAIIYALIA